MKTIKLLQSISICVIFVFFLSSDFQKLQAQEISTVAEIYDYEIGDIFHESQYQNGGFGVFTSKRNFKIINKYYINDTNVLVYVKDRIGREKQPWGEWYYYHDTVTEQITNLSSLINGGVIHFVESYPEQYNGRLINRTWSGDFDPNYEEWVAGCGMAGYIDEDHINFTTTGLSLVYYKKGNEEWGTPQIIIAPTFITTGATWNVARTFPNANPQNPSFVETTTKVYGFIGDTIIENKTWAKFYSTPDSNFMSEFTYLGNFKEENGIILFMDSTNSIDSIYNFGMQIGDSVNYDFGFENRYSKVENIDTVEINGELRKRYYFEEPNYPPMFLNEVWIEGIGSIHGPLFPKYPALFSDEIPDSLNLTCYKIYSSIMWNNPFYENCYVNIVLSTEEISEVKFSIFPNPAGDYINFQSANNKTGELEILSFSGVTVKKVEIFTNHRIDISRLKPGIYILKINYPSQTVFKKLVKV